MRELLIWLQMVTHAACWETCCSGYNQRDQIRDRILHKRLPNNQIFQRWQICLRCVIRKRKR
ncbi:hypothetical protein SK128_024346 [Halocaridina rubra]|uniref:Secreted protein n=1 Tax=Halocaridina rubra TaxID=373956 RepID=A0AAN9ABH8_HALRR